MQGSVLTERLETVWQECQDSERLFPHKRVLFIGSESFDAQAAAVFQGLDALGFEVCTIGKPNISSWAFNKVVADPAELKFDFVLSTLHWGTRFTHFQRFNLSGYPKVLIDGDDTRAEDMWLTKYERYRELYICDPPEEVRDAEFAPYRWMDDLDGYEPDVLFTLQKHGKQQGHYIPKGMRNQWLDMGLNRALQDRAIDFAHIPGDGVWRSAMRDLLDLGVLPGNVHNSQARGVPIYPAEIQALCERDAAPNTHSYHRWICWTEFYRVLNDTRVLIFPGIDHWLFWEAARIYEGWACGCLVAMSEPTTDVSDYPPTGVCPEAVYASHNELIDKARFWYAFPDCLDRLRKRSARRAYKYFTPASVARYFLQRTHDTIFS